MFKKADFASPLCLCVCISITKNPCYYRLVMKYSLDNRTDVFLKNPLPNSSSDS